MHKKEKRVLHTLGIKGLLNDQPLNKTELKTLNRFLEDPRGIFYCQGALTALLSAPEKEHRAMPVFLPLTEMLTFTSKPLTIEITALIQRLYHSTNVALSTDTVLLPLIDTLPLEADNFWESRLLPHHRHNLKAWCKGYLDKIDLDHWFQRARKEEHIRLLLDPLALFSTETRYAKRVKLDWKKEFSPLELREMKIAIVQMLPQFLILIYDFWRVQAPLGSERHEKTLRVLAKNDPCPCLSTESYKRCCGSFLHPENKLKKFFSGFFLA